MKYIILTFFVLLSISRALAGTEVKLGLLLFPPNVIIDEDTNECVGKNITITRELLSEYDIDVEVVCSSPLRIYPMLIAGEIDFTINIKSTENLAKHVVFSENPFRKIRVNLYSHIKAKQSKSVSAVSGFMYQGFRHKLAQDGFEFIDLETPISAIQVFLKKKSDYMLSYETLVQNYLSTKKLSLGESVLITRLDEIDTFYAVAKNSPHLEKLTQAFNDFAAKHKVQYIESAWPRDPLKEEGHGQ